MRDKTVYAHMPIGNSDWYICETGGEDLCFRFCSFGDLVNAEWGYVSLNELKSIIVVDGFEVDNDLRW